MRYVHLNVLYTKSMFVRAFEKYRGKIAIGARRGRGVVVEVRRRSQQEGSMSGKQKECREPRSSLTASIANHLTPRSGPLDAKFTCRLQLYLNLNRTTQITAA